MVQRWDYWRVDVKVEIQVVSTAEVLIGPSEPHWVDCLVVQMAVSMVIVMVD